MKKTIIDELERAIINLVKKKYIQFSTNPDTKKLELVPAENFIELEKFSKKLPEKTQSWFKEFVRSIKNKKHIDYKEVFR